jgi:catechol 2,3-dioxygenase-like lactoylglutathione lyase family enzyme
MERYIGLGVLSQSGKRVGTHVVETSAKSLIALLDTIPGRKHVCLEEGTMAGWLYEVLSPHVGSTGCRPILRALYGNREAYFRDPDGNVLRFGEPIRG